VESGLIRSHEKEPMIDFFRLLLDERGFVARRH
jgi:hypothetical protein